MAALHGMRHGLQADAEPGRKLDGERAALVQRQRRSVTLCRPHLRCGRKSLRHDLLGGQSLCGGSGCGVVFKLTPNQDGSWTESVLHSFNSSDGAYPSAGLIFDAAGNLYGTPTGAALSL